MNQLPKKPGTEWRDRHEVIPVPIKAPKYSLTDMSKDFHFFNHGALFAFGGLTFPREDPLNDWYAMQPKGTPVIKEAFRAKIFEGMPLLAGNATWDHVLCGVRHVDWQGLWQFLCGTAICDRKTHKYREVFSGDINILDPVLIERFSVFDDRSFSEVRVTVFGIDGNDHRWEPALRTAGVSNTIGFNQLPPRQAVLGKAALVLDGDASILQHHNNQASTALFVEELAKCKSN
jgi:hypothetical protein